MEQVNICMHDYRGFGMFGDECEKKHFRETCNDKECISSACPKSHQRFCYFRFASGKCNLEMSAEYREMENCVKVNGNHNTALHEGLPKFLTTHNTRDMLTSAILRPVFTIQVKQ